MFRKCWCFLRELILFKTVLLPVGFILKSSMECKYLFTVKFHTYKIPNVNAYRICACFVKEFTYIKLSKYRCCS